MANFIFDIETVVNCITFVFINANTDKAIIQEYIDADINNDIEAKHLALTKIDHKIFIIYDTVNDVHRLVKFIRSDECTTLIGYNSLKFDDLIVDKILNNYNVLSTYSIPLLINYITDTAADIVNNQNMGNLRKILNIKYSGKYVSIDLMKLHALDKAKKSLKQVQILLNWYRVEDYTPPEPSWEEIDKYYYNGNEKWFEIYINNNTLQSLLDYNINDVLSTLELFNYSLPELQNRIAIKTKHGLNVLSDSRSAVADKLLSKAYSDATGLNYWDFADKRTYRRKIKFKDIIINDISYQTKELQDFLIKLKDIIINVGTDKFNETIIFKGTAYTFAKGGLHSKDIGSTFISTDKYKYIDVDADSYYPSGVVNYRIKAEHLADVMIDIIDRYRLERIHAKKIGDKTTADINKLVLNSGVFGKLGFEYSYMYDLKAMYKVTINLQLILLVLIEDLELNGIHVVSANTDGIVSKVHVDKMDIYKECCERWSKRFNFGVEYTHYAKYIRTTVNDYISIKTDGKVKLKGDFKIKPDITTGYFAPVIAKTLYEYYVNDRTNIDEVIRSFHIYDYCIAVKVGGQYRSELHTLQNGKLNVQILQKDNRYFVSNKGGIFLKYELYKHTHTNVIKGKYVTIFNNYYESDNYNIDYNWYKSKVLDIINKVNNSTTKLMKKTSGNMFDELY